MLALAITSLLLSVTSCSGLILRDNDSGLEKTGKVAARVLLCPVTLCISELEIAAIQDSPQERAARQARELDKIRHWIRGPLMHACAAAPGPETRQACSLSYQRALAEMNSEHLLREDHYRVELAMAKATDEIRTLGLKSRAVTWVRRHKTSACKQAPSDALARRCLKAVDMDLDILMGPENAIVESPEVRAERAVVRIEARQQEQAIERQRQHERDMADAYIAGQVLQGYMWTGGPLQNTIRATQPPAPPSLVVPSTPGSLLFAPPVRSNPPVSCTSLRAGSTVYTDCY